MKKQNKIIRSTKCSLKFSNKKKLDQLHSFIDEYTKVYKEFVGFLWQDFEDGKEISRFLPKEITQKISSLTLISNVAIQCAGKQASGVVRGTIKKHKQRLYVLEKLKKESNNAEDIEKLQQIIENTKLSKPEIKYVNPELDARFVEIQEGNNTYNIWLKFDSLFKRTKTEGRKRAQNHKSFLVPVKKTKHFNDLINQRGFNLNLGIRLSKKFISFNFEKEKLKPDLSKLGETIGIDIGIINCWTDSRGMSSTPCPHGHNLKTIQEKLSRSKKGSKGFKRAQEHRTNYMNWSIKKIDFSGVKQLNLEKIYDLRRNKKSSRFLSHWRYKEIFERLESLSKEQGVLVKLVEPTYTSQRCSSCGWTQKKNRKGKYFKCVKCGFTTDADLNGSTNIALDLPAINRHDPNYNNKKGFYWNGLNGIIAVKSSQELIVPDV